MKKENTLLYVLLGAGAIGLWYWYKKNNAKKEVVEANLVAEVIKEEQDKYNTPFNAQYRIVMPYQMVSKKVKEKAAILTQGRYAPVPEHIKEPLYI